MDGNIIYKHVLKPLSNVIIIILNLYLFSARMHCFLQKFKMFIVTKYFYFT